MNDSENTKEDLSGKRYSKRQRKKPSTFLMYHTKPKTPKADIKVSCKVNHTFTKKVKLDSFFYAQSTIKPIDLIKRAIRKVGINFKNSFKVVYFDTKKQSKLYLEWKLLKDGDICTEKLQKVRVYFQAKKKVTKEQKQKNPPHLLPEYVQMMINYYQWMIYTYSGWFHYMFNYS